MNKIRYERRRWGDPQTIRFMDSPEWFDVRRCVCF
ncbi:hypothetical protein J2X83_003030 [Brevibacillus nitrificans]|nr:hypothetical protein [Brevibacillus nitrificans]